MIDDIVQFIFLFLPLKQKIENKFLFSLLSQQKKLLCNLLMKKISYRMHTLLLRKVKGINLQETLIVLAYWYLIIIGVAQLNAFNIQSKEC